MASDLINAGQMAAPVEFMTFLKQRYMLVPIKQGGEEEQHSQWEEMKAALGNDPQRISDAAAGIKHFIECAQGFLAAHQPAGMHYLAQGVGLELGGGHLVSMVAPQFLDPNHAGMEQAHDIPVTIPRSQVGQHGIVPSQAVAVTGAQPESYQAPGNQQPTATPGEPGAVDPNDPLA